MHKISGECDASEEIDGVEYDFKIGYTVSPKEKMTRGQEQLKVLYKNMVIYIKTFYVLM